MRCLRSVGKSCPNPLHSPVQDGYEDRNPQVDHFTSVAHILVILTSQKQKLDADVQRNDDAANLEKQVLVALDFHVSREHVLLLDRLSHLEAIAPCSA